LASLLRFVLPMRGDWFSQNGAGRESDHHSVFCRLERTGATTFVEKKIITWFYELPSRPTSRLTSAVT
jgi:hypothetical protein